MTKADRHDAEVFRIEQEILKDPDFVSAKRAADELRAAMLEWVTQLVEERLAPIDARAARIFLDEIDGGELP